MTISKTWIENFKLVAPAAFDKQAPADISTVFIDGQLKLQCPQGINTWDVFFDNLYRWSIERYLRMPGVTTVVLGFDDHLHSPLAKGPTQVARRAKNQHIEWCPSKPLPNTIPADYDKLLCNKEFKSRVIAYVVSRIEGSCKLHVKGKQRIIIDYQNEPYVAVGTAPAPATAAAPATAPATAAAPATAPATAKSPMKRCLTMSGITAGAPSAPRPHKTCATDTAAGRAHGADAAADAALTAPAARALEFEACVGRFKDSAADEAPAQAVVKQEVGANFLEPFALEHLAELLASAQAQDVVKQEKVMPAAPVAQWPRPSRPEEFCTGYLIPNTVPLGECDVKFVRYLKDGDMILDAVDSDYVIIGMCQIERLGPASPRIFVRRLTVHPSKAAADAVAAAAGVEQVKPKKPVGKGNRGFDFFPEPGQHYPTLPAAAYEVHANESSPGVPAAGAGSSPVKKAGREFEYVDCGAVVAAVATTFGAHTGAELKPYTIRLVAFVVALCGCDFTEGVKYLNGSVATKSTRLIWSAVCAAARVDKTTGALVMDERVVAEGVIGKIWKHVQFPKVCGPDIANQGFEALFELLAGSSNISQTRRDRLVTPRALGSLVRNCNWTVFYWADPERCPCAVHGGDYGFVLEELPEGSRRKKQVVKRDDKRPLARGVCVSAQTPLAVN
jgi:hypothetical protein